MNRLALAVWLLFVWVALWREISTANLVSGALIVAVLFAVFPPSQQRTSHFAIRPIALAKLAWYFVHKVVESNVVLVLTIMHRQDRLRTAVIAVPLVSDSEGTLTVVANLTALTPGMMVLEVERDPALFYVHTLQLSGADAVRIEVRTLERLVVEAFGAPAAVAAVRAAPLDLTVDELRDTGHEGTDEAS